MANRPFRASYLISGVEAETVFAELLTVHSFPEWAVGLRHARVLDAPGKTGTPGIRPGARLEFTLSAAGFTHGVVSAVTAVEPPHRLEWRYERGATGHGGWLVEEEGWETVRLTLSTDYSIRPAWLDRVAHRTFFRGLIEDLLGRSIRRFEEHLKRLENTRTTREVSELATVFTRIIDGDLPARFVWRDERCVAFLSINPLRSGHVLVVPKEEVDHWLDLDADLMAHLMNVSRSVGEAIQEGFEPARVGLIIAGLDVPHVHLHVLPVDGIQDMNFENAAKDPDPAELDQAADTIRRELVNLGFGEAAT